MIYRIFSTIVIALALGIAANAQNKPKLGSQTDPNGKEISIIVTAVPHGEEERLRASRLQPGDFAVYENKRRQRIVSVRPATELPMSIAVVVQDNLSWRVNSELKVLKDFIGALPEGTRVMTAYLTIGGAIVTQEFTTDRKQAAGSLRIIRGGSFPPSFSPYDGIAALADRFSGSNGRRVMLVVSNGLDVSRGFTGASPYFSVSLDAAIASCQRSGVAVYAIYAPGEDRRLFRRFEFNYGQGSLIRLADETGGESYMNGIDFIDFSPYLKEFSENYARQWVIVYKSSTIGKGFRRIEVTTDFDVDLHHPSGYTPKTRQ